MSDDEPLSQNLEDYDAATREVIEGLIREEQGKTRAMLAPSAQAGAVLIGGVGAPDGLFGALGGVGTT